jgi:hypothetical protein
MLPAGNASDSLQHNQQQASWKCFPFRTFRKVTMHFFSDVAKRITRDAWHFLIQRDLFAACRKCGPMHNPQQVPGISNV